MIFYIKLLDIVVWFGLKLYIIKYKIDYEWCNIIWYNMYEIIIWYMYVSVIYYIM